MAHIEVDTVTGSWPAPLSDWERINHVLDGAATWLEFTTTDGGDARLRTDRIVAVTRMTDEAIQLRDARTLTENP